ncbi:hypothetical protein TNIN_105841 [Trichonephila inaurata madagascariensis]|uniref:Uncharacterized protein n=1 Tax=Trichonephila inaurata madagascariensis TaxID=2747483 RepID=A0A8X7C9W4_9ARAC|nr:hypothetical protein TNIN_105841 [Trichonephila inaurata madagascariensis]
MDFGQDRVAKPLFSSSAVQLGMVQTHSSSAGCINHPIKNAKCGPGAVHHDHVILETRIGDLGCSEVEVRRNSPCVGEYNKCVKSSLM